jgi:hypothetical protein
VASVKRVIKKFARILDISPPGHERTLIQGRTDAVKTDS